MVTVKTYVLRVRIRFGRSSRRFATDVEPINTRLMLVPPEFATSSVSGLFEMKRPQGSEPTGMLDDEKPLAVVLCCQTFSKLNAVFDKNTLPRAASTAMSPITPCCGNPKVRP